MSAPPIAQPIFRRVFDSRAGVANGGYAPAASVDRPLAIDSVEPSPGDAWDGASPVFAAASAGIVVTTDAASGGGAGVGVGVGVNVGADTAADVGAGAAARTDAGSTEGASEADV